MPRPCCGAPARDPQPPSRSAGAALWEVTARHRGSPGRHFRQHSGSLGSAGAGGTVLFHRLRHPRPQMEGPSFKKAGPGSSRLPAENQRPGGQSVFDEQNQDVVSRKQHPSPRRMTLETSPEPEGRPDTPSPVPQGPRRKLQSMAHRDPVLDSWGSFSPLFVFSKFLSNQQA